MHLNDENNTLHLAFCASKSMEVFFVTQKLFSLNVVTLELSVDTFNCLKEFINCCVKIEMRLIKTKLEVPRHQSPTTL